jgi:ABC-type branched-chain amino acid transport systems, ATPase component
MRSLLSVEGISVRLDGSVALRDVSLHVGEGEVVAVVGPNGSGKTTLLRTIAGFLRPSVGRVVFDGADVTPLRPSERSRLGIRLVPSEMEVFPAMSLLENLRVSWEGGARRETFDEALERVVQTFPWIEGRLRVRAGNLSGGERRMLAMAMALLSSPKLLMIDEPSSGLSPKSLSAVLGSISSLSSSGLSVLLSEQNVDAALRVSKRVVVLRSGVKLAEYEVSDRAEVAALIRRTIWG